MYQRIPSYLGTGVLGILLLLSAAVSMASDVSGGPFLRLNSWMHSAGVTQISVDPRGLYLASSSYDRTVKVWDLKTHQLLATFRPPIGQGDEGILLSVAVSSDGRTLATGGHTKAGGENNNIYIFDIVSRKLINRVPVGPESIYFLAYSPDGKYLAVLMWPDGDLQVNQTSKGLQVYQTSDWAIVGKDSGYKDKSYWAAFDPVGRLVTTSMDGYVRLYDREFRLIAKELTSPHKEPFGVSFSPDGQTVAVGFTDSANIAFLSGNDLKLKTSLTNTKDGHLKGDSHNILWSQDGKGLYVAGWQNENGDWLVRYWKDITKQEYIDIVVGHNTIMDLRLLPVEGVSFATLDPMVGFIDSQGKVRLVRGEFQEANIDAPDLRANVDKLEVSQTGEVIQFANNRKGNNTVRFSVADRTLIPGMAESPDLTPPNQIGLRVENWYESEQPPSLEGKQLAVEKHEKSHSLAISANKEFFILGTERHIYCFSKKGTLKWKVQTDSMAWGVNITGNSKIIIAALGDGTIHWYLSENGRELLTFFAHSDMKRWILWNSAWFYDVSQGGEDLIGWHVNRGWDKASDFFPVELFRGTHYRPDIVRRALSVQGENSGLSQKPVLAEKVALDKTPPVVHVLFPEPNREVASKSLVVKVEVHSKLPITRWLVKVGADTLNVEPPVEEEYSAGKAEKLWRFVIDVPEKDCTIGIIAFHKYYPSDIATVPIKWVGSTNNLLGELKIVAIGVSTYKNKQYIPSLKYAHKDAKDLVDVLKLQEKVVFSHVEPRLLTNKGADTKAILKSLVWLRDNVKPNDVAVIFIAGHGMLNTQDKFTFLPYDYDRDDADFTSITSTKLFDSIGEIKLEKVVVILDTCRSGALLGSDRKWSIDYTRMVNLLLNPQYGGVVISAGTGSQLSKEVPTNGRLTKRLIDGLRGDGDAADSDGDVYVDRLGSYLTKQVKNDSFSTQIPATSKPKLISDFILAKKVSSPVDTAAAR